MRKRITLKVNQPGIMFKLNGNKFRSPVEVDITQMKIDPIIAQMRIYGIIDYEISTVDKNSKNINDQTKIIVVESKTDEIDRLNSRIDKLEDVLHKILDKEKEDNKISNVISDKDWEQNNNSNKVKTEKVTKPVKKKIEKIKQKKVIVNSIQPKIVEGKPVENEELYNKKIIIEELEDINIDDIEENIINIEEKIQEPEYEFKVKDFKYEENVQPFQISQDIENLKKFKK